MAFWNRLSLRNQTVVFVGLSLIVLVTLYGYVGNMIVSQSLTSSLKERQVMAIMSAEFLDEMLKHYLAELNGIARSSVFEEDWGNLETARRIFRESFSQSRVFTYNFFVTDNVGTTLLVEPEDPFWTINNTDRPLTISAFAEGREWYVSGVEWVSSKRQPIVTVAVPIRDGDGNLMGALGANIDLTDPKFSSFIEPIRLGKTGHSQLVDSEGFVVASTLREEVFKKSDHSNQFASLMKSGQPTIASCHRCHTSGQETEKQSELLIFAPLKVAPWGVAIRQSEEEAFEATYALQRSILVLGASSLVVALFLSWMAMGRLVGRIQVLTSSAKRIASGDLKSPVPDSGQDEIGTLAKSFDDMRTRIDASQKEIEMWNEELERKVETRTRELSSLYEASKILTSSFEIEAALKSIVTKAVEIVEPADAGALLLYDSGMGRLIVKASTGFKRELLAISNLQPGEGIPGRVFHEGKIKVYITSEGIAADSQVNSSVDSQEVSPAKKNRTVFSAESAMAVPLVSKSNPIGVLILSSQRPQSAFSDSDVSLVESLCDQIAIAVENANLIKEADEVRALQQADKLKSEFIANISHELRTPLASIKGFTSTLLRKDANWDEESRTEFLRIVDEESDKLRELIDNLFEISKMGAGSVRIYREPILMQRVARRVVEQAKGRTEKHAFELEFSADFPVVEADQIRIEQVLQNLVENAIKYSPDGGTILIEGKTKDDQVVVSVKDEGIGISQEEVGKIFQRFYRVDNPTTRQTGGSGLGLSIVKWIVEAHGGEIWVESVLAGGSSFYFTLPYVGEMVSDAG